MYSVSPMLGQEACVNVPDTTGAFAALSVAVVEGVLFRDDVDLCDLKDAFLGPMKVAFRRVGQQVEFQQRPKGRIVEGSL